jgi:uncharacterized membrane protein
VFLKVESLADPTSYDESRTVTAVVIPDIAVLGINYLRADGSEVDGTDKRLVVDEESTLVARVTNLRRNTDISNLRVRFAVDGVPHDVAVQNLPADGVTDVPYDHTFSSLGVHSVQVTADPFEVISDAVRSNNIVSDTVTIKSRTPVGSYELTGSIFISDGVTPAAEATVRLTVEATGYSFTVAADGAGVYNASLADSRYSDGDAVTVNATDEGVHYNVALEADPGDLEVDNGDEGNAAITLKAVGTRDVTVDLSVAADGWSPRLRYQNGTSVTSVVLPVGSEVGIVLSFTVPIDAEGDTDMTFSILAVPREDPDAGDELNVTAVVNATLGFTIELITSPPDEAHPGERRMFNLSVTNIGNVDDTVDLSYDNNFLTWNVVFDVPVVPLPAFRAVTVRVTLDVPTYVQAEEYVIAITGVSRTNNTVVANTHITVTVEDLRYGVSLNVDQPLTQGKPDDTVWWQLQIRNLGNVEDTYDFTVFGLGQEWSHRFKVGAASVNEVVLAPGESEAVVMEVDIPIEFTEVPTRDMKVTVKVGSLSEATAFNNTVLDLHLEGIMDLTLDVTTSTNDPVVGTRVVFTVSVINLGPDDASGVKIYGYFGDDTERKTVGTVAAEGTEEAKIEWLPFEAGPVTVRIVVNPVEEEDTIWEISYENNEWVKPMKVSTVEDDAIWEDPYFWVFLIVIIIVLIIAVVIGRGRGIEAEEATELVEVVDEDEVEEDLEEDEDLQEDEEYEDENEDGEEYEDENEDGEEYEDEEDEDVEAETEPDVAAFTVGRM